MESDIININTVSEPSLYLLPVPLSDGSLDYVLPPFNIGIISHIKHYIVENVRSARRFLKKCNHTIDISSLTFYELNTHTDKTLIASYLDPIALGENVGVISEAGCPAVADPGADVVAIAQQRGYRVIPLVGPSSILMAVMGSGFNGQSFAFNGYLPVDSVTRLRKFKDMEQLILKHNQTQIFIETPYRNNKLIDEMLRVLPRSLKLCIASDITGIHESIVTRSIDAWKKSKYDYDRIPTIYVLYK